MNRIRELGMVSLVSGMCQGIMLARSHFVILTVAALCLWPMEVVAAQGLPKSYTSEHEKSRFELSLANEFRRQKISIAYHESELRESEYLRSQQFVELLSPSDDQSLELRRLLKNYDLAIKSLHQELRSGISTDKVSGQVTTTADEIRDWYETKLTTEQRTVAKAVAIRRQILCNGIRDSLHAERTFRWFNESVVVDPVADERLEAFSEFIQHEWAPNSRAALAATIDVLLNGIDHSIVEYVKDRVLSKGDAVPIELCIVRMREMSPKDKNVERDLKWMRTGSKFSFKIGLTGQLERGVRIQDDAFPLAILLSDGAIRESMKMELLPEQVGRINEHFQAYLMAMEPLSELAKTKSVDSQERKDLDRSLHQVGDQYSDLVEAELLPAQWQQVMSVSRTRDIYEHGLYATVEKIVEEFEAEHETEIDRERMKRNSVKALEQLDQEIARLESRYRGALRSEVGDSNRALFSLLELAMVHSKEPCLSLFVFGSTRLDRVRQ